jgi:hypothetical protein
MDAVLLQRVGTTSVVAPAVVTLGYSCPRAKCDFTLVLDEMAREIGLKRWHVDGWCGAVVRGIDQRQDDHDVARLDAIRIRRMGRDLVHLVNIDRPGSGVTGLVEGDERGHTM